MCEGQALFPRGLRGQKPDFGLWQGINPWDHPKLIWSLGSTSSTSWAMGPWRAHYPLAETRDAVSLAVRTCTHCRKRCAGPTVTRLRDPFDFSHRRAGICGGGMLPQGTRPLWPNMLWEKSVSAFAARSPFQHIFHSLESVQTV
jgi:hypothetical protein